MPGPLPKNPKTRSRTNRPKPYAVLAPDKKPVVGVPPLAKHPDGEAWHPYVLAFWQLVWRSPMAAQFVEADIAGLFRMAMLTHRFMKSPTVAVSAELRMLSQSYGLSPLDRRRLEWTIAKSEDAVDATTERRSKTTRGREPIDLDPRDVLK